MKNWKYIKIGNEQKIIIPRNDMADTPDSAIAKDVYAEYLKSGKNKQQTLLNLLKKNQKGNRKIYEDTIDRVVSAYEKRSLNESIDKQEWSMFKGLGKKAEEEIGNADPSTDMRNEYNAEIHRLEKKMEEMYRRGQGHSAMQIQKQIEQLQRELREIDNKKTVNETKAERKFGKVMGEFEEGALKTPQGKTVTDPAQAKAIAYSEADKVDNLKRARNAMNKKVGNLYNVEEGDYVSVRYKGEIVDGVVRKIQGTQALVTIDGTDMWFPIRSLKEST